MTPPDSAVVETTPISASTNTPTSPTSRRTTTGLPRVKFRPPLVITRTPPSRPTLRLTRSAVTLTFAAAGLSGCKIEPMRYNAMDLTRQTNLRLDRPRRTHPALHPRPNAYSAKRRWRQIQASFARLRAFSGETNVHVDASPAEAHYRSSLPTKIVAPTPTRLGSTPLVAKLAPSPSLAGLTPRVRPKSMRNDSGSLGESLGGSPALSAKLTDLPSSLASSTHSRSGSSGLPTHSRSGSTTRSSSTGPLGTMYSRSGSEQIKLGGRESKMDLLVPFGITEALSRAVVLRLTSKTGPVAGASSPPARRSVDGGRPIRVFMTPGSASPDGVVGKLGRAAQFPPSSSSELGRPSPLLLNQLAAAATAASSIDEEDEVDDDEGEMFMVRTTEVGVGAGWARVQSGVGIGGRPRRGKTVRTTGGTGPVNYNSL
ncbi:hypothetical protein FRC09_012601 [Ceratobasidium sp. 395]|nr:hypothetical protein FRC09_012601 [Ceratobasidium sp. 395]